MYQLTGEGWRGWGGMGGWEADIGLERWDRFNPCRHTDFPPYQHKVVLIPLSIWTTVEQTGVVGSGCRRTPRNPWSEPNIVGPWGWANTR